MLLTLPMLDLSVSRISLGILRILNPKKMGHEFVVVLEVVAATLERVAS